MKWHSVLVVLLLLTPRLGAAQTLHGYPGKAAYASSAEWPFLDGQCHWVPGGGSPVVDPPNTLVSNMSHTHVGIKAPIWGELGSSAFPTVDLPIAVKLFHTAGMLSQISGQIFGLLDRVSIPVQLDTLPVVGDPSGLVVVNGHVHLDPRIGLPIGIPRHGWFSINIVTQTFFDNGDVVQNGLRIPFYSMIDPTGPEENADTQTIAGCSVTNPFDGDIALWGGNLVEFRQMLPILAPFSTPQVIESFGYAYSNLATAFQQQYELLLDADFHMGIPGSVLPMMTDTGGASYHQLNPAAMTGSATPMGLLPNQHRLTFQWSMASGDGIQNPLGHVSGGQELRTLMSVVVTTGDNPTDTGPATLWTTNGAPIPVVPPPVVEPPPVSPWIAFLPIFCRNTSTGELKMFALASCADVP